MTFTLTDIIALGAVIISALSFLYSIVLNIKQGKYIKHQDELNKLLLKKEKAELEKELFADVSARIVKFGQSKYYIRVYNQGKNKAINVNFEMIDSKWMIMNHAFPLEYLDPGSSVDLNLALFLGCEQKGKCIITWEDKSGKQEREVILLV
jgi:hypothetical protein